MKTHQVLVGILVLFPLCAAGQPNSRYNLNHVRVELMDGRVVSGKWITASDDTLVIEVTAQKTNKGLNRESEVIFRLKGDGKDYAGTVAGLSNTTMIVRLKDQPDTTFVVDRQLLTHLEVVHSAVKPIGNKHNQTNFPVVKIRSIRLHYKGAGAAGFTIGLIAGYFISGSIVANNFDFGPHEVPSVAYVPLFLGPTLGVAIGTTGKKHIIEGSHERFKAFVQKITMIKGLP